MSLIREDTRLRLIHVRRRLVEAGSWLTAEREVATSTDVVAFLDPIDQFILAPGPRYLRSTLYILVGLVLALALIAAIFKVDEFATAKGHLVTSMPPIPVQPVDRSIVREIRVRTGDHVTKGQVLAVLDPTFAQVDLGTFTAQRGGLQAQHERIEAELKGAPYAIPANASEDQRVQVTLFEQRRANYASRMKVFDEEIAQLQTGIKTAEADAALLQKQLAVAHEVEEMRESLFKSQNGSRLNYLDAQALTMRSERDYRDAVSRFSEMTHQLQSRQAEKQAFADDWRRQLLENQAQIETQLGMLGANISKASLVADMVTLTAQADGTILDMSPRAVVGSVVHEADPLLTIMPSGSELLADIEIGSGDVGSVKAGDEVLLKMDAFPYTRHGMVKGELLYISEEASSNNSLTGQVTPDFTGGGTTHRGQVRLTETHLENIPAGAHLLPGMTLQAEVKVGTRSILAYFLSPVLRGLGEALHEE